MEKFDEILLNMKKNRNLGKPVVDQVYNKFFLGKVKPERKGVFIETPLYQIINSRIK